MRSSSLDLAIENPNGCRKYDKCYPLQTAQCMHYHCTHCYHRASVFFCLVCDQSTLIFLLMKIQMNTHYALEERETEPVEQRNEVAWEQMTTHESMTQHTNASCVSWCVRLCTLSYQNYSSPGEFTTFFFHSTLTLCEWVCLCLCLSPASLMNCEWSELRQRGESAPLKVEWCGAERLNRVGNTWTFIYNRQVHWYTGW